MSSASFILTYNPIYWYWPIEQRQPNTEGQWNVGTRKQGIKLGDDLYVLQQGSSDRGLLAHGVAISTIYQAPHWDGIRGHVGNHIDVRWTFVGDNPLISTSELHIALPRVNWQPRQSGMAVPPHSHKKLGEVWGQAL